MESRVRVVAHGGASVNNEEVTETIINILKKECAVEIAPRFNFSISEEQTNFLIEKAEHDSVNCLLNHIRPYIKTEIIKRENIVRATIDLPLMRDVELKAAIKSAEQSYNAYRIEQGLNRPLKRALEQCRTELDYLRLPFYKKWFANKDYLE